MNNSQKFHPRTEKRSYERKFNPAPARNRNTGAHEIASPTPVQPVTPIVPATPVHTPRSAGPIGIALRCVSGIAAVAVCAFCLSSGHNMHLRASGVSSDDRDTIFSASIGDLLSASLSEIHNLPKCYLLELNGEPTPVPDKNAFTKLEDDERQNETGEPIDYYHDDTITVKCWKEHRFGVTVNYADIQIAHPSQFRRKLVDDVISKNHVEYPLNIFKKMNGVVGMTSDYCAFRSYGTIVQYNTVLRDRSYHLDLLVVDYEGNLSFVNEKDFYECEPYKNHDIMYTFAFGPILVDNYEINPKAGSKDYICGQMDKIYPRAAIGQYGYDKHYLLCTADYESYGVRGMTGAQFAEVMQEQGVRIAYNMDGGQTAALMYNGKLFNRVAYGGQRKVSDILYFATAVPNE